MSFRRFRYRSERNESSDEWMSIKSAILDLCRLKFVDRQANPFRQALAKPRFGNKIDKLG